MSLVTPYTYIANFDNNVNRIAFASKSESTVLIR